MHRMVQVVLVQFIASTHKERGRPIDWYFGPMQVLAAVGEMQVMYTYCLHP